MSRAMMDTLMNLKFTSRSLARQSKKAEKAERSQKKKLKKAIEKGNMEGARIYAQNAIREKNQALNLLRLASRVDAVTSRVQTAVSMHSLTKSMKGVVKGMDRVLRSMDTERISAAMDSFEKQFEDLDVRSAYMEGAISSTTAMSTPEEEVDGLIRMVADEHGLEVAADLDAAGEVSSLPAAAPVEEEAPASKEDELAARLRALHGP